MSGGTANLSGVLLVRVRVFGFGGFRLGGLSER